MADPLEATPENIARVEAVNRSLVSYLGADKAAIDASRVLRLPGFQNVKDPAAPYPVVLLGEAARRFTLDDFTPIMATATPVRPITAGMNGHGRAGDDYSARGDWPTLLTAHGWSFVSQHEQASYWCKPGSFSRDVHARLNWQGDGRLKVYTTKAAPLDPVVYTLFSAYTVLEHGGDFHAAAKGMDIWLKMVDQGVIKKNVAEVTTPATVNEFKAGQVAFAINWGFAWDRFKDDADSQVKGKVGVMPLPAVAGGKSATCVGGWQWAVSAFSKSKPEAAKLVQYMASPSSSKFLAVEGSLLPTIQSVYTDADVTKAVPWFKDAANVVIAGQARPISARYGEVSDAIRTTASAILARTKTPAEGVAEIDSKLSRVMR